MEDYLIAVFQRPGDAAIAQRDLMERNIKVAMMPTPRGISVSCGLSLRIAVQEYETIKPVLLEMFPEKDRCCFFAAYKDGKRHEFHPVVSET
ncbi:MAG: DUF3343 domain-containing protein [Oscillospiraceae bacterium]|nr:DUF3343 domain-containing protein [Oscillospiraceae bacterium]